MKKTGIPFVRLVVLVLAVASCTDANSLIDSTDTCKGRIVSGEDAFGGPYAIGGKGELSLKDAIAKVAEFEAFWKAGWFFSEVECLDNKIFKDSVQANKSSDFPFADGYQRYNYVIVVSKAKGKPDTQVATIHVAKWRSPGSLREGSLELSSSKSPCKSTTVSIVSGYSAKAPLGMMVNFFPEEPEVPTLPGGFPGIASSPCSVTLHGAGVAPKFQLGLDIGAMGKNRGVLDAHGKHFMLRQSPRMTLANFPTATPQIKISDIDQNTWVKAKVAYAGEIIVDILKCTYLINQGSGTYKPAPGNNLNTLKKVAKVFETVLGSKPSHVVFVKPPSDPEVVSITGDLKSHLVCPGMGVRP